MSVFLWVVLLLVILSSNRMDQACAMAMLVINQCEDYELVATAGSDALRKQASEHIKYPQKGFGVFKQIMDTRHNIGGGGIFTKQMFRLV